MKSHKLFKISEALEIQDAGCLQESLSDLSISSAPLLENNYKDNPPHCWW